jgi:ribonuclease P protein component
VPGGSPRGLPHHHVDAGDDGTGREGTGFPREARITGSTEIRTLFRRGKRRKTRHLDVFVSPSPVARPRIGIVVPKHKHDIVDRNLVKRRLRDAVRRFVLPLLRRRGAALDVMLRARPEAYGAPYAEMRDDLVALAEELCSRAR